MTLVIAACLWVLASAAVAMLPMRHQYVPGIALMLAAPVLIYFLGQTHGVWMAVLAGFAFLSMFRNPLRYLFKRVTGRVTEVPK